VDELEHILEILKRVKKALDKKEYITIKKLSDEITDHASMHQDSDLIATAVIIYSLSKLIEREDYKKGKEWTVFYNKFCRNIDDTIQGLEKNDIKIFRDEVAANRALIDSLSRDLKTYITDVFRKAKINKASRLYDQGISMEKTAKILGVSIWELQEYTGQKKGDDVHLTLTWPIKNRIKLAEEIFQ
jgi:hypothetical protein